MSYGDYRMGSGSFRLLKLPVLKHLAKIFIEKNIYFKT